MTSTQLENDNAEKSTDETDDTLKQILNKLDALSEENKSFNDRFDALSVENKSFNDKFDNYQKATQWVVQLAFSLIASATITVIITSVLRK